MKPVDVSGCRVQVLVCTNRRVDSRTACADFGGEAFFMRLKQRVKENGLAGTHWVTRTGCLGFCNTVGTTVAIHRSGERPVFFTEVRAEDFDSVWAEVVRQ